MKKIKSLLLIVICFFAIATVTACKKKKPTPTPTPTICTSHVDNNNDNVCDVCGTKMQSQGGSETSYDFMGADFIIMVDLPESVDPRLGTYQKQYQEEKKALIEKVEKKYNLHVVYKQYPSSASWGGARERYIIENTINKTPQAHVYEIPSYSIGSLAVNNAISPLDDYIKKYGNPTIWPESLAYGSALGHVYGYSDIYPLSDEGIYYNMDLLEKYLGEGNGDLPSRMWLEGNWTWETFENMCKQLNEVLPSDNYVIGGMTYNWAYQMLGANGVHVVNTDLKSELATQAGIDTIGYLNRLYNTIRWDATTPTLDNATSTEMVKGKVAFHNGQSYWLFQDNKWNNRDFKIGYVPYPVGTNVKDTKNLTDYYCNDVYGKTQYCISSSYSKSLVQPGYENSTLHDEIIFQIWSELQYFPEADETGYASTEDWIEEYKYQRLKKYYGSESSVEAHVSVIQKAYPDYFYSLDEAKDQIEGSYMLTIQGAITSDGSDIRSTMINLTSMIHASFKEKYKLPDDYYDEK